MNWSFYKQSVYCLELYDAVDFLDLLIMLLLADNITDTKRWITAEHTQKYFFKVGAGRIRSA